MRHLQDIEIVEDGAKHTLVLYNCKVPQTGELVFTAANAKCSANLKVKGELPVHLQVSAVFAQNRALQFRGGSEGPGSRRGGLGGGFGPAVNSVRLNQQRSPSPSLRRWMMFMSTKRMRPSLSWKCPESLKASAG